MLCRVRFSAIRGGFSDQNFPKFSWPPQNFAFEIARDRTEIRAGLSCTACARPAEVPDICAERQHAVPREILCDLERISDRNFRGRKILHSKSRQIAPKSAVLVDLQPLHDVQGSSKSVPTVRMLRRVRLHANRSGFRTEIFEKFSQPQNFPLEIARERIKNHPA